MSNPRAYFKALRLGDTVRSHPPISTTIEAPLLTPTAFGADAAFAENGASSRVAVEIEPVLIRSFAGAETDAAYFARKAAFANDLRDFAGPMPTDATTRLGTLCWVEDPETADRIGTFTLIGVTGPPDYWNTLSVTAYGTSMASGDRLLIVEGDLSIIVTLDASFSAGGTTIQFEDVLTSDWPAFTGAAVAYRLAWWLDEAAMSGEFKAGDGERARSVSRGSVLRFDSVERIGTAG